MGPGLVVSVGVGSILVVTMAEAAGICGQGAEVLQALQCTPETCPESSRVLNVSLDVRVSETPVCRYL